MENKKEEALAAVSKFISVNLTASGMKTVINYLEQSKEDTYRSVSRAFADLYLVSDGERNKDARIVIIVAWLLSKENTKFYFYHPDEEPLSLTKEENELFKGATFAALTTLLFTVSPISWEDKVDLYLRPMSNSLENDLGLKIFFPNTELFQLRIETVKPKPILH